MLYLLIFMHSCDDLLRVLPGVFSKFKSTEGAFGFIVDNLPTIGEKKCRKKYFFDSSFAVYFASMIAGNIPITKR